VKAPIRLFGAVALVIAGYALYRFVLFPSSSSLSAEQIASLSSLGPQLPALAVSQADAATLIGDANDCASDSPGSGPPVDPMQGERADTAWCSSAGAFVMSTVALPAQDNVDNIAREVQLHAAPSGQAVELAKATATELTTIEGSAHFVAIDGIGPYSHALKFRVRYPSRFQVFDYYRVHFVENFVDYDLTLVLPGADANDGAATTLSQLMYDPVGQALTAQAIPTVAP
jgi:hypothetical protein